MRTLSVCAALLVALPVASQAADTASPAVAAAATPAEIAQVRDAVLFGFPVYEMMRTRGATPREFNRLAHRMRLSGPADRAVTAPNNDTLYSSAWLDLVAGPVTLTMPSLPDRYHSVHMMDVFTDAFAVLGTRDGGGRSGTVLIVGPEWRGKAPAGARLVRATTNDVWIIVRTLVSGPADFDAAQAGQLGFSLSGGGVARALSAPTPLAPDAKTFVAVVNEALARSPVPQEHRRRLARLAKVGIGPEALPWDRLAPGVRAAWEGAPERVRAELSTSLYGAGRRQNGWVYPAPGLGRFGQDDFFRSRVALGGLAALPGEEATYLGTTTDGSDRPLDGSRAYTLTVPADVPVEAFWSLTAYASDGQGRWFLHANPIDRYSMSDRTPGVRRGPDGSITILLQNAQPTGDAAANWLPTPPGPYRLSFRAYLPGESFRDGRFLLPAVIPAEKSER
jgi:hypothetical protein